MWQWMKRGSTTTTYLRQKDRHLSGQQMVKADQSDQKVNSGLTRLWNQYFGTRMVFSLSTILRKVIVYYVSRRIMRVITRWATMLAVDRSRGAISPASILSESRNYPNCVHWHIFYFMCFGAYTSFYAYTRIQSEKVEIAVIIAYLTWHFGNTSGHSCFLDLV